MSIKDTLAQFAVANNNSRPTTTPVYELNIEEARAAVTCVDSAKIKAEDGSQALSLRLSRRKLSLDPVKAGASVINAPAEQVESFTAALLDLVAQGEFDEQIIETQGLLREAALAPKAPKVTETTTPEGLDLSELDTVDVVEDENLDDLV